MGIYNSKNKDIMMNPLLCKKIFLKNFIQKSSNGKMSISVKTNNYMYLKISNNNDKIIIPIDKNPVITIHDKCFSLNFENEFWIIYENFEIKKIPIEKEYKLNFIQIHNYLNMKKAELHLFSNTNEKRILISIYKKMKKLNLKIYLYYF